MKREKLEDLAKRLEEELGKAEISVRHTQKTAGEKFSYLAGKQTFSGIIYKIL